MTTFDKAIIELTIQGKTQRCISVELDMHIDTVHDRLSRLKTRHAVQSLPQLIAALYENNVIKNFKVV